jgi:hypothetical protein
MPFGRRSRSRRTDRRAGEPSGRAGKLLRVDTESFHDFLVASGGVAGALLGLLFVAISVAPGRLQGEHSSWAHRVRASPALTVSPTHLSIVLFGPIPDVGMGWTTVAVGALGGRSRSVG